MQCRVRPQRRSTAHVAQRSAGHLSWSDFCFAFGVSFLEGRDAFDADRRGGRRRGLTQPARKADLPPVASLLAGTSRHTLLSPRARQPSSLCTCHHGTPDSSLGRLNLAPRFPIRPTASAKAAAFPFASDDGVPILSGMLYRCFGEHLKATLTAYIKIRF